MPREVENYTNNVLTPAQYPENARTAAIAMAPDLALAAGTVLGIITADNVGAEYATANVDGTGTASALLMVDIVTDADGRVSMVGDIADPMAHNYQSNNTAPVFVKGVFDPADLIGWDADAAADMGAKLLPNGFIDIP